MKIRTLLLAAVAFTLPSMLAMTVQADTEQTTTVVKGVDLPGVKKFDLKSFDDNHDGIITVEETGDHLFRLFDLDSNGVIDNIEFTKKTIITVIPVESQTYTYRDYNSDGHVDASKYDSTTFMERSGLAAFDKNKDGLSAADFVKKSFLQMDRNHSHVIEPAEWRDGYVTSHIPEVNKQYRYNN